MLKIASIVLINVKQGIREKTFWVVGFFFLFLLGFSAFLGELSIGEKEVVLRNISLSSIEISCLFLVAFSFVYNFYREKDTRLKEVYLSYFSHATYLGGKFISYLLICLIYILLTSLAASFVLSLDNAYTWHIFIGSYGIFLKLSIFCGFCLLFSSVFNYPLLSSISTVFAYIASELSYNALKIVNVSENVFIKISLRLIYYILPNTDKIDLKYQTIYGKTPSLGFLTNITLYVIIYVLLLYYLSVFIFHRREH